MNLQRREEISALLAEPVTGEAGQVLEYRDALMECRAHIDTLEQAAAERVIARGAVVKPHTFGELVNQVRDIANQHAGTEQLRERIAYALAPHFERDAGPTPDYTGEGSAWVPPAVAPAVVVPEVPMGTALQRLGLRLTQILDGHEFAVLEHEFLNPAIEEMQKLSVLSDRALGEGMVAVDREEWRAINEFADKIVPIRDNLSGISWVGKLSDVFKAYDQWYAIRIAAGGALRANQGGANE